MNNDPLIDEIRTVFPRTEAARLFFAKHNILLEEVHGFTPANTRFAEGGCCDEINEPEHRLLEAYWGERFKFGGLAGYCHGGRTGLQAVSHHVPEAGGVKNLLLVGGPHIGYHRGKWGRIQRPGQEGSTPCCGSIASVLRAGRAGSSDMAADPLDLQQHAVSGILAGYLKQCTDSGRKPDMVDATLVVLRRVEDDLQQLAGEIREHFDGRIGMIIGVMINTVQSNYFSPSKVDVL